MARRRSTADSIPLSPIGEELIALAFRAGLDPGRRDDLRRVMSVWARRYRLRSGARVTEDAALVALTVSYLRKYRDEI